MEGVHLAAHRVAQRMASEGEAAQQRGIGGQHQAADSNMEAVRKEKALDGVMPEKDQEEHREIHEVPVQVLEDEREFRLSTIILVAPLVYGASRRIEKEGPIVGLSIVIAREAKASGRPEDQDGGRK